MKTSALVIPLALFAIFTISEISCEETCAKLHYGCLEHSDCCSENCYMAGRVRDRYCLDPKNATQALKVQNGLCSYNQSFHNESSDEMFNLIGINAAHPILPIGSKIEITDLTTNKTIDALINTFFQPNNGTLLQLSKEAANALGVKDGESIPCSIYLYEPEPDYSSLKKIAAFSASFFVVVFIVMTFL